MFKYHAMTDTNKYSNDYDEVMRELERICEDEKFKRFVYNIEISVYVIKIDGIKNMIILN